MAAAARSVIGFRGLMGAGLPVERGLGIFGEEPGMAGATIAFDPADVLSVRKDDVAGTGGERNPRGSALRLDSGNDESYGKQEQRQPHTTAGAPFKLNQPAAATLWHLVQLPLTSNAPFISGLAWWQVAQEVFVSSAFLCMGPPLNFSAA